MNARWSKIVLVLLSILCLGCMEAFAARFGETGNYTGERYRLLYADEEASYSADMQTIQRIKHPYLNEDILDVWVHVKVQQSRYVYPEPFTLYHYYVRLAKPQIQRMQAVQYEGGSIVMETSRAVFRDLRWKDIVPESPEEHWYNKVVQEHKEPEKLEQEEQE